VDRFIGLAVEILRLVPLILAFYIPALLGMAILKERGEGHRFKAALVFALGFGGILFLRLIFRSVSASQVAGALTVSAVQIALALVLAALTVYKLAD
jgi:hypothetical protein